MPKNNRKKDKTNDMKLYKRWSFMKGNAKKKDIEIASEWLVFEEFRNWVFENGYQTDSDFKFKRINKEKGYIPENCTVTVPLGDPNDPLLRTWYGIKGRCYVPGDKSYESYGAKGIELAPEWLEFAPFKEWAIQTGYKPGSHLRRKNRAFHYEPNNCEWVDEKVYESKIGIEINGEIKGLKQLSKETGISYTTLRKRYYLGMSIDEMLKPTNRKKKGD
ncbi:hypothetical protein COA01_23235 [Bacillus cereus]|uniref:hypothetical protein n=1 Tax=Bacillus cereus TaxID=1396 RepID=UPI000BFE5EDE|nr:hypothetical protein [Bacillus cereus]PGP18659.1 hypothetical protein COA01_23235 [Bacillus cereus]